MRVDRLGRPQTVIGAALIALALGCAAVGVPIPHPTPPITVTRGPQICETFRVDTKPITITRNGRNINLGGGNRLVVPDNAVTTDGTYNVAPIYDSVSGKRLAGLRIDPVAPAESVFQEPIELIINYAGCPFEGN